MKDDPFLEQWEWDLTTRKNKQRYEPLVNWDKKENIEQQVTDVIQKTFSFVILPIGHSSYLKKWKAKMIATVAQCRECRPSTEWLGLYSPKRKIRENGLWQEQYIYGETITSQELALVEKTIKS